MAVRKFVTPADVRASQMRIVQMLIEYRVLDPVPSPEHADLARILEQLKGRSFLFLRQEEGRALGEATGTIGGVSRNLGMSFRIDVRDVCFDYLMPELRPVRKARPHGPKKWTGLWHAVGRFGNHVGFLVMTN